MDIIGARTVPFLARRNYTVEFRQFSIWSVVAGLVEGQFGSVVVAKIFGGGPLLIGIAAATPMAAFISSLYWGVLCTGRPKVRLLVLFSAGTTLCTGLVGAIPHTDNGAVWFICQMAAAQVLMAGVLTIRSAVWKSNYPQKIRGQITARLQRVRFIVTVGTVLVAGALCDANPSAYRFIFPVVAVFGVVGTLLARGLHIRGERGELSRQSETEGDGILRHRLVEPLGLTALLSPGHVPAQMLRVLRDDRAFRNYCIAQFWTGMANLMTVSVVATVVTRDLAFGDQWGFWVSTALIVAIPQLVVLASLARWGRLFDRLGVLRFRVINVSCWTLSLLAGAVATIVVVNGPALGARGLPLAVMLFALRGALSGLARGGGALAWHIGHLHFADQRNAEVYMGIHVSLTGMRGMVAPLMGIWLWHVIGWYVWVVAICCSLVSLVMYAVMARAEENAAAATDCPQDGHR